MKILRQIKNHCNQNSTGKCNILLSSTGKFLGSFHLERGHFIKVDIFSSQLEIQIYKICLLDFIFPKRYNLVFEPENMNSLNTDFRLNFYDFINNFEVYFSRLKQINKWIPPEKHLLELRTCLIFDQQTLSDSEKVVLPRLSSPISVIELYESVPLTEDEITLALVTLRKKNYLMIRKKSVENIF